MNAGKTSQHKLTAINMAGMLKHFFICASLQGIIRKQGRLYIEIGASPQLFRLLLNHEPPEKHENCFRVFRVFLGLKAVKIE
jgi:hypothetical protein